MQSDLPFPRGTTLCEGDTDLISRLDGEYEGRRYKYFDPTTGGEQELIILKASAALTSPAGIGMKHTSGYFGRRVDGAIDAAGVHGFIADPSLPGNVASGDLFYGIYAGEVAGVKVNTTDLTQGGLLQFHSNGMLTPLGTSDAVGIGVSNAAVTAGSAGAVTATITVLPPAAGQNAA